MKTFAWVVLAVVGLALPALADDEEKPNCTLKVQTMDLKSGKKSFRMEEIHVFNQKECKAKATELTTKTEDEEIRATSSFRRPR